MEGLRERTAHQQPPAIQATPDSGTGIPGLCAALCRGFTLPSSRGSSAGFGDIRSAREALGLCRDRRPVCLAFASPAKVVGFSLERSYRASPLLAWKGRLALMECGTQGGLAFSWGCPCLAGDPGTRGLALVAWRFVDPKPPAV